MSAAPPPSETATAAVPAASEVKPLLKLAWPLIGNNLVVAIMNLTDTLMAGGLSGLDPAAVPGKDLAAVSVGNSVWNLFFMAAMGVLLAVSPLVSQCYGAANYNRIGSYVREGMKIGVTLGLAIVVVGWFGAEPGLRLVGIDESFRAMAVDYTRYIIWGAPAICCFLAVRFGLEGIGNTIPILICSTLALIVNVAGNFVFIYGYLGMPALGGAGCGVASAIAMWFLLGVMLLYARFGRGSQVLRVFQRHKSRVKNMKQEIFSLGLPIAGNVIAEVGLFIAVTMFMGRLSASAAAGHQIALSYASTVFMIPMAVGSAITVRVGHAVGAGQLALARMRGYVGVAVCAGFMLVSSAVLLIFKDSIVWLYTRDPVVSNVAVSLLFVAAVFQLSDGIQVAAAGALRGFKDTQIPFLLNLFSYWVVGFSLTYHEALSADPTPRNIWVGFVVGLTLSAVLLMSRYRYLTRRKLAAAEDTARSSTA